MPKRTQGEQVIFGTAALRISGATSDGHPSIFVHRLDGGRITSIHARFLSPDRLESIIEEAIPIEARAAVSAWIDSGLAPGNESKPPR